MYRLLIVDDERHIVNWLYGLFASIEEVDFDIYKAYSGHEALSVLRETSVDIILSDFRMPGMSGLELFDRVKANWANRRVIFLSAYNQFDYIYQANARGAVKYILKTEDDEVIINAVLEAVKSIEHDRVESAIIDKSRLTEGLMEYLDRCGAVSRYIESPSEIPAIPFDPVRPVLPVLGSSLLHQGEHSVSEQLKFRYSLELLSARCFSSCARFVVLDADHGRTLWILQELPDDPEVHVPCPSAPFLGQLFEEFQVVVNQSYHVEMSFILQESPVPWEGVRKAIQNLGNLMTRIEQDSVSVGGTITFAPAGLPREGFSDRALAAQVRQFIEKTLGGDLTLTNISRNVYYNPSYISRVFKRETGTNLTEYISEKRIEKAAALLSGTAKDIHDIAQECGFDSPQYFSTVFKKIKGSPPQAYRKQNKSKEI